MEKHAKTSTRNGRVSSSEENQSSPTVEELVNKAVMEKWRQEYLAEMNGPKIEIVEVKNSQSYISEQYDNLKSEYDELTKIKDAQEKKLKS